jgi:DNA-binding HxlR family transcriptional regulator
VRVDSRLTEKGEGLAGVVDALVEWADRWVPDDSG